MDDLVKLLSADLDYESHEISGDKLYIRVKSNRKEPECPYCGKRSTSVHSRYERSFSDLPIQGKKVTILLENRKYFCKNHNCEHKTFAETFDCLPFKGKRSKRLTEAIIEVSLNVSSVNAASTLRRGTADVGKSTICSLLKKGLSN